MPCYNCNNRNRCNYNYYDPCYYAYPTPIKIQEILSHNGYHYPRHEPHYYPYEVMTPCAKNGGLNGCGGMICPTKCANGQAPISAFGTIFNCEGFSVDYVEDVQYALPLHASSNVHGMYCDEDSLVVRYSGVYEILYNVTATCDVAEHIICCVLNGHCHPIDLTFDDEYTSASKPFHITKSALLSLSAGDRLSLGIRTSKTAGMHILPEGATLTAFKVG